MLDSIWYRRGHRLGELGSCQDTWSAAYQMNAMVDAEEYCSQDWPGTIPHQLFAMFQGTFAIITPVLIIGGLIDRMKFSALVIFVLLMGNLCLRSNCTLGLGWRIT